MTADLSLLGQVLASKRSAESAQVAFSKSLTGPKELRPAHYRAWRGALDALHIAHKTARTAERKIIPFPRTDQ